MSNATYEDRTLDYFQVACAGISIYNAIEVLILAFATFTRYNTLYFWSICGCAMGCLWFAAGFIDLFYELYLRDSTIYRPLVILTIGWYGMVTGFALVMWSRLHLVSVPKRYINLMLGFIIYNVCFSHFPTTVMTFGANVVGTQEWKDGYNTIEKIQMTFFCLQEVLLGALYLHYTRKLRLTKKVTLLVRQTLIINCVVLMLDIATLIFQYANMYEYQIMLKVVMYSIKLKMEFYILNILAKSLLRNVSSGGYHNNESSAKGGGKEIAPANTTEPRSMDNVQSHSESQSAAGKGGGN